MLGLTQMDYGRRMRLALTCSVVLHVLVVLAPTGCPWRDSAVGLGPRREPLVLNLEQEPRSPQRLVESLIPSDEAPSEDTDLISDVDTKASDVSDVDGERFAPFDPDPDEFDRLARRPDVPAPTSEPHETVPAAPQQEPVDDPVTVAHRSAPAFEPVREEPESESHVPVDEAAVPDTVYQESAAREDGGVTGQGVLGFEAKKHELASYMQEVRKKVEGRWRAMLELRYQGPMPARAVLDCGIRPDGSVAYVRIVEEGEALSFAPLCKEAIESAGPFPPFPFEVPKVYRSNNIEIRWTFNFS